jgi:quinol monooxygenase YgiN
MAGVGRYVKMTARPGRGAELARTMLRVADSLRGTPGCELYLVSRPDGDPDVVWVTELWSSRQAVDASLEELRTEAGAAQLAQVMALLAGAPERIELEPIGGVGYPCRQ